MAQKDRGVRGVAEFLEKLCDLVWGLPHDGPDSGHGDCVHPSAPRCAAAGGLEAVFDMPFAAESSGAGEVSPFAALCTALAATIGTGNIVGVATAICTGGPGALFWMLVAALLGMATQYAEGFLAIRYRTVEKDAVSAAAPLPIWNGDLAPNGAERQSCLPAVRSLPACSVWARWPRSAVFRRRWRPFLRLT